MNERNPVRWLEPGSEVPDAIRDVVGSAALDEVGPEQLSRFVERAQASIGGPAPSPAGRAALSSGKVVAGLAVAVGGAVLAWMLWGRAPAAQPEARPRAAATAQVHEAPPGLPRAPANPAPTHPEVAAAPAPSPTSPTQAEVPASAADPTRVEVPRGPVAPQSIERTSVSATRAASPSDSLAEEVRLLQGARESLGADPAGALRLAEQHRSRFPGGTLTQEREVIAIDALIRQGRTAEAQARADRFRDRYPRSSHLDRLSNLRDNRD